MTFNVSGAVLRYLRVHIPEIACKDCLKILLAMKLTVLLLTIACVNVSAAVHSQGITLRYNDVPFKNVIEQISRQSGYSVLADTKDMQNAKNVTVSVRNASLEKALIESFKGQPFTYEIVNKTILIKSNSPAWILSGSVLNSSGEAVPGASVTIKGTTVGTTTKTDGTFSLNITEAEAVLIISSIGYAPQEIVVSQSQPNIVIILETQEAVMESVVITTALGIKRAEKSLTYNAQEVKGDEVTKVRDANFVNALQGKVAGVTINTSANGIGGGTRVIMRGTKSLSGNNNALYVIDGVPMPALANEGSSGVFGGRAGSGDGISNINPDDIESMTVLSGPSAAALYGSDAANGVVIINTKRGAAGRLRLNVYNTTSLFSPFVLPKLQKTYGQSGENAFDSWGSKLATPSSYNPAKDFFQTGSNVTTGFDLSGGTKSNQTFFSASIVNGEGIIPNNKLKRYNFSFRNTSSFLEEKLNIDLNAMYIKTDEQNMLAQGQYSNPLLGVYLFPAGADFESIKHYERYNPVRNFNTQYWPLGAAGYTIENPYWVANRELFTNNKDRYILGAGATYKFTDWLDVASRVKFDRTNVLGETKFHASTIGVFAGDQGGYVRTNNAITQIYADAILTARKDVADFNFNVNIGSSIQDNKSDFDLHGGNLAQYTNLFVLSNINRTTAKIEQDDLPHVQRQSVFGNAEIGYRRALFLNVSARNDWASTLAGTSALKSGFFYPSVGLSAVLTDLFEIRNSTLSYLKLRGSYSSVGNALPAFISRQQLRFIGAAETTKYGYITDLQPENTKSYEAGFDARFFSNKVSLTTTLYHSNTYNQLFRVNAAPSSGYDVYMVNAGNVENRGIEAVLGYNGRLINDLRWTSALTFSLNRNKILEMLPAVKDALGFTYSLDSADVASSGSFRNIITTGGQMGDVYVNTLKTDNQGYIYVDPGSGKVTPQPQSFIYAGNANPRYNVGFRNEFGYKGMTLGFLFDGRFGGIVVSQTQAILDAFGASQASADARDAGGVMINDALLPNVKDYYQTVGAGDGILSPYVYSATNVRLREAFLSYTIPAKLFNNKIQGLTLGVTGRNLWMIYNKAPFDPEVSASTGTYYQGIDYWMMPSLRSIGFNIKVNL